MISRYPLFDAWQFGCVQVRFYPLGGWQWRLHWGKGAIAFPSFSIRWKA